MITPLIKQLGGILIGLAFAASVPPLLKVTPTIQEIFAREGIHLDFHIRPRPVDPCPR